MFGNVWNSLTASSTKFAFVIGIITLISQAISLWPFDTAERLAMMITTAVAVFMSVYTVHCMNVGGCNRFAWFSMLLPVLLMVAVVLLNTLTA